jgi:hypothetical protein
VPPTQKRGRQKKEEKKMKNNCLRNYLLVAVFAVSAVSASLSAPEFCTVVVLSAVAVPLHDVFSSV